MMTVQVRMFARFRDVFGAEATAVELPDGAGVAALRGRLGAMKSEIVALLARSQIAVNGEFAADELTLQPADEIALIPPVSGG